MRIYARALLGALMLVAFAGPATVRSQSLKGEAAETDQSRRSDAVAAGEAAELARVNEWTVGIAGGQLEGTFLRMAAEIGKALDDGDNLRILPILTYGAADNVSDLLYMRGVDLAITYADALDQYKKSGAAKNIDQRINYISELFEGELHIYARPEIRSLADLEGKKVGFNTKGAGPSVTGPMLFDRLGIHVEPVFINNAIALEQMKTGEIAAILHLVAKPNSLFAKLEPPPGFHFLSLDFDSRLADYYVPARLTHEDYPNLIAPGVSVDTIGVPAVLAVYNWPKGNDRFRRVERFIDYYFTRFERLKEPSFHPGWKDVNLAAKVPGWNRYWVADDKLAALMSALRSGRPLEISREGASDLATPLDREQVQDFVSQTEKALPLLSDGMRSQLGKVLDAIRSEMKTETPDEPKVRQLLRSARAICERDASNLVNQGILALLAKFNGV
jgi:TRAP-type uncharacterized transport system substrate-binding protein